jgi:hypothetical protein
MFVKEEASSGGFPSGDEISSLLQTVGPNFISKILTIYLSEAGAANTRNADTARVLTTTAPTDIHGWELVLEEYVGTFGEPFWFERMMTQMMVMTMCTLQGLMDDGAVPETCYDNTIADIYIGAGGDIDSEFDLFTWEGIAEGFFIATIYYAVETSIVAILEKTAFVLWYGMDSTLEPGSALFLWSGFDFITHCTFWNHGDILGDGCAAGH